MATPRELAEKLVEDLYPHVLGVGSAVIFLIYGGGISSVASTYSLKIDQAYSGVFGLATVFTGFLFTFYTFVITADNGFIGRARSSLYLRRTMKFTVTALKLGGISSLLSLLMMVWQPNLEWRPGSIAFSIWFGLSVCSSLAFERAARLFVIFCRRHSAGVR